MGFVKTALIPLDLVTSRYVRQERAMGCIPHALSTQLFGNARQPYRQDPASTALRQRVLLRCGYKPALQDCDSCQVAYMLYSINATFAKD